MHGDLPDDTHRTPPDVDETTVEALGKLSEALETVERARGHLYTFHQLTGSADFALGDAVALLRQAGHTELADRLDTELLGRNVVPGRWTFQLVEEYDDGYWSLFRGLEQDARDRLAGGTRHLHEARLKEQRRSPGQPGHEATP
ncbi:hypothetical protein [Ornithinicoccus halotolerans]|uniref:hypothetical protein n=1 Tax=Ornithinicoccus halotolerans TaxID=1748220 RepID=UPI001297963C|nr:hypothetical protein [Ornithinicoccus halotolerans]